jgi:predicted RNA-binding protein YlxR (DUF448 family)
MMAAEPRSQRARHVPVRTCVVCRTTADKRALTRVVRTATGVVIDPSGKLDGRGAYLCANDDCWQRAVASSVLEKALRATLTEEDRHRLLAAKP